MAALGDLLARTGRAAEGEPLLREALADRTAAGDGAAALADLESRLGGALATQGKAAEAEELLVRGLAGLESAMGPEARLTVAARSRLETFRVGS
jgi:hypothetical protein